MSAFSNYQHIVFRTKSSRCTIPHENRKVMLMYIYRISEDIGVKILRINAHLNHVHILANIPPRIAISDYVKKIKGLASKNFKGHSLFPLFDGWAVKFGSFSKSESDKDIIVKYIAGQDEHHKKHTFQEELEMLFGRQYFQDILNRRDWFDE